MKRIAFLFLAMTCLMFQAAAVSAEEPAPLYPGFPTVRESKAYKKFSIRTYSEFSKILYLIDRYSDSQISINYEDQNYTAAFSTTVARWFLSRNYKKQTAREWVKQWCNKSIFVNKPIYVKLPNGKFRLAREILMEEVDALEKVVRENQEKPVLAPTVILTAAAESPQPVPAGPALALNSAAAVEVSNAGAQNAVLSAGPAEAAASKP